jgi:hypothetical protein
LVILVVLVVRVVSEGVEECCVYLRRILCGRPLTSAVWKEHHISYCYEETVPVCRTCHARVHLSDLVEGFKLYGGRGGLRSLD